MLPPGSPNIHIEGLPAARATDQAFCKIPPPDRIAQGCGTVHLNGEAFLAARVTDKTVHGGQIDMGASHVHIGVAGDAVTVLPILAPHAVGADAGAIEGQGQSGDSSSESDAPGDGASGLEGRHEPSDRSEGNRGQSADSCTGTWSDKPIPTISVASIEAFRASKPEWINLYVEFEFRFSARLECNCSKSGQSSRFVDIRFKKTIPMAVNWRYLLQKYYLNKWSLYRWLKMIRLLIRASDILRALKKFIGIADLYEILIQGIGPYAEVIADHLWNSAEDICNGLFSEESLKNINIPFSLYISSDDIA